jgi:hypothetical protein
MSRILSNILLIISFSIFLVSINLPVFSQEFDSEGTPTAVQSATTADGGNASTPLNPCETIGGCIGGIDKFQNQGGGIDGVLTFLQTGINIATYISVPIAVVFIIIGGYNMMTSQGDEKKYNNGLSTLQYAIAGFVLILLSGTIIGLVIGLSKSDISGGETPQENQSTSQTSRIIIEQKENNI